MARLLYRGCEPGMDVMELQDGLNNARLAVGEGSAFEALTVDGAFGPLTQSRVLEFQRGHGLGADGIVGAKTWGSLETVLLTIPGLEVRRPLGGGGNPGAGPGTNGSAAYGKPGTGGPDVAGAAAAVAGAASSAAGAAWSAAQAALGGWGSWSPKGGAGGGGGNPKTGGGGFAKAGSGGNAKTGGGKIG